MLAVATSYCPKSLCSSIRKFTITSSKLRLSSSVSQKRSPLALNLPDGRQLFNMKHISRYSHNGHNYHVQREPRSECGYFDGDHLYGMMPIRQAILSGRRKVTELLLQKDNTFSNKKDKLLAVELMNLVEEKGIKAEKVTCLEESDESFKCVLALDEVEDPQNFGALIRTCHYLGVDRIVIQGKKTAPLSPAVSSISIGAVEFVTVNKVDNLVKFLELSKKNGWQIVGTSLDDSACEIDSLAPKVPTILVLGNEGSGVRPHILDMCTTLVKIAGMPKGTNGDTACVDSLNVSVTGGIILYHILKNKIQQKPII